MDITTNTTLVTVTEQSNSEIVNVTVTEVASPTIVISSEETDPVYLGERHLLAFKTDLPSKTSDLTNDSGFITIASVPTKVSDLSNDTGFITLADIPAIPDETDPIYQADKPNIAFKTDIPEIPTVPTKTSELTNDSGFITLAEIPPFDESDPIWISEKSNFALKTDLPTRVGQLENDKGFIDSTFGSANYQTIEDQRLSTTDNVQFATVNNGTLSGNNSGDQFVPTKVSELENDLGFLTEDNDKTKLSEFENDTNFITINDVPANPTKVSELENDTGFITSSALPTKVSQLQNDSNFISASLALALSIAL